MNLNQLRHFVAVAEELHFGRAARRLGMAQSPLSQSIQRLEKSLGLQLLERDKLHVALTAAGAVLMDEARRILSQLQLAEHLAKRAATGGVSRLRIAFTPASVHSSMPRAVTEFRRRWPGIEILLEEHPTNEQIALLLNGMIDIGVFIYSGEPPTGLSMHTISRSTFAAAVPSHWPIAKRAKIRLADLAKYPWIMHDPSKNERMYMTIIDACRTAGFVPKVALHANQGYSILRLVAGGSGVCLSSLGRGLPRVDGVTHIKIADLPPQLCSETRVAWAPQAVSPQVNSFLSLVRRLS
jgi:DNA-binding transcriptional LysR family regulator